MPSAVVLFDGVCNLCNGTVQLILKRDKKHYFKFASLQSDFAQKQLPVLKNEEKVPDSIVLLENGILYYRSTAALKIAGKLSGAWPLCRVFLLIPVFVRDAVYNFIARHRYQWFGKKNSCLLSDGQKYRSYFIE